MNLVDTFTEKATQKGWDTEVQVKLLLDFIDSCSDANARDMEKFLESIDEEGDTEASHEDCIDEDADTALPLADDLIDEDEFDNDDEDDDDFEERVSGKNYRF